MSPARSLGMVFLAVAVLMIGALPSGFGQNQPPKYFIMTVTDDTHKVITRDLDSMTIWFNVTVTPNQPGNPLNGDFDIIITGKSNSSAPAGWSYGDPSPSSITMKSGDKKSFTAVITLNTRPPSVDSVSPQYTFHMTPVYRGTPGPLGGVTGQLIQQMSQEDEKTAHGDVGRSLTTAAKVSSFVKDNKWYLLAAAGGILIVGVVLVRKKGGGIAASTDQPVQEVLPGRGASFPIEVRSEGNVKQNISLTTSQVPEGWSAILPVDRLELAGNDSSTIWLTLKAPSTAIAGQHVQVSFIATNPEGVSAETLLEAVVVDRYGGGQQPESPMEMPPPSAPARRARGKQIGSG